MSVCVSSGVSAGAAAGSPDPVAAPRKPVKLSDLQAAKAAARKADELPAEFDYLDQIPPEHDADYTGANSGDELGNELGEFMG